MQCVGAPRLLLGLALVDEAGLPVRVGGCTAGGYGDVAIPAKHGAQGAWDFHSPRGHGFDNGIRRMAVVARAQAATLSVRRCRGQQGPNSGGPTGGQRPQFVGQPLVARS